MPINIHIFSASSELLSVSNISITAQSQTFWLCLRTELIKLLPYASSVLSFLWPWKTECDFRRVKGVSEISGIILWRRLPIFPAARLFIPNGYSNNNNTLLGSMYCPESPEACFPRATKTEMPQNSWGKSPQFISVLAPLRCCAKFHQQCPG